MYHVGNTYITVSNCNAVFGASSCMIKKPCERGGHSPRWAAVPEKINKIIMVSDVRYSAPSDDFEIVYKCMALVF
jgi:hypothetical protein